MTSSSMRPTPVLPRYIKGLPVDPNLRMPIPWFVHVPGDHKDGDPLDFRVVDGEKFIKAIKQSRCWICGCVNSKARAYLVGPMCEITGVTAEPPMHLECATYAVQACPFLSNPAMRRSPRPLPKQAAVAGNAIERNPGVTALILSRSNVKPFKSGNGYLLELPQNVYSKDYWCKGRAATFEEVWQSVTSGLPLLVETAMTENTLALIDLMTRADNFQIRLHNHFQCKMSGPPVSMLLTNMVNDVLKNRRQTHDA